MGEHRVPVGSDGQTPNLPKSVFVTGASGFIGRALVSRYQNLGCEVRGVDLVPDAEHNIIAGDVTKPAPWSAHAKGCDLFIHTAAVVSFASDWETYREITVQGTRNALDAAISGGAKRFVHFSSIAALGWEYPDGASEKTPVVIGDKYRYGVAKGASEQTVLAAHAAGEIDCTIVRPGDIYGPGSRAFLIEPIKLIRSGKLVLPNGGKGVMTPLYIDDLVDGTILAGGLPEGNGQIFILWGGVKVTSAEFFGYHWRWAGRKGKPPSLPLTFAVALTKGLWTLNKLLGRASEATPDAMYLLARTGGFSMDKARETLGFLPKVEFSEGMKRSEVWLRESGELPE